MTWTLHCGDARNVLATLPAKSVQCCVTSPPYWGAQRDYGTDGQLGMERTPEAFSDALVGVFEALHRVLKDDGCVWLNLGDSYAASGKGGGGRLMQKRGEAWGHRDRMRGWRAAPPGYKAKDVIGVPWLVATALRSWGWILRKEVIWEKANPTEPRRLDRPSMAHETVFLLVKQRRYFFDRDAVPDGDVWRIPSDGAYEMHFATMPRDLARRCVRSGSAHGQAVIDPFAGAATTGVVAVEEGRSFVGIELSSKYHAMARERLANVAPLLATEIPA